MGRVGRVDTIAGPGQGIHAGTAYGDPAGAGGFCGQDKIAGEGGAGLEDDFVSRLGVIQGFLEVIAGVDGKELTRGRDIRGIEIDLRKGGKRGSLGEARLRERDEEKECEA